jgi:hypothetical protein
MFFLAKLHELKYDNDELHVTFYESESVLISFVTPISLISFPI